LRAICCPAPRLSSNARLEREGVDPQSKQTLVTQLRDDLDKLNTPDSRGTTMTNVSLSVSSNSTRNSRGTTGSRKMRDTMDALRAARGNKVADARLQSESALDCLALVEAMGGELGAQGRA